MSRVLTWKGLGIAIGAVLLIAPDVLGHWGYFAGHRTLRCRRLGSSVWRGLGSVCTAKALWRDALTIRTRGSGIG